MPNLQKRIASCLEVLNLSDEQKEFIEDFIFTEEGSKESVKFSFTDKEQLREMLGKLKSDKSYATLHCKLSKLLEIINNLNNQ